MLYDKTGKVLLYCPAGREGDVSVPDGVETIGYDAFAHCTRIRSLAIPPSVRTVRGPFAAYTDSSCTALRAVYISDLAAWCGIRFETVGYGYPSESANQSNPLCKARNLYLNGRLLTDAVIPLLSQAI